MKDQADSPEARSDTPIKGFIGAVVGIGLMVGLVLEIPELSWALLITVPLGVVVAAGLYWWHKKRPITEVEEDSIKLNLK